MRRTLLLLLLLPALLLSGVAAHVVCLCGLAGEERRPATCCKSHGGDTPAAPEAPQPEPVECQGCVGVPLLFDTNSRPELPRPEPLALVVSPVLLPEALCARAPPRGRLVAATAHPPPGAAFRLPLRI